MSRSIIHDDILVAGGVALERALTAVDESGERPDGHRPGRHLVRSNEHHAPFNFNGRRLLNECREVAVHITHAFDSLNDSASFIGEKKTPLIKSLITAVSPPLVEKGSGGMISALPYGANRSRGNADNCLGGSGILAERALTNPLGRASARSGQCPGSAVPVHLAES